MHGPKTLQFLVFLAGLAAVTKAVHYSFSTKSYVLDDIEEYNGDEEDEEDEDDDEISEIMLNPKHHLTKRRNNRGFGYHTFKRDLILQCRQAKKDFRGPWSTIRYQYLIKKADKENKVACLIKRKWDCIKHLARGRRRKRKLKRRRENCRTWREDDGGSTSECEDDDDDCDDDGSSDDGNEQQETIIPDMSLSPSHIAVEIDINSVYTVFGGGDSVDIADLVELKERLEGFGCEIDFNGDGPFSDEEDIRHYLGFYEYTVSFGGSLSDSVECESGPPIPFSFRVQQSRCPEIASDSTVLQIHDYPVGQSFYTVELDCIHPGYELILEPGQTNSWTCLNYEYWSIPNLNPLSCEALECANPATSEFQVLESCNGPAGNDNAFFTGTTCTYFCGQDSTAVDESRLTITCTDQMTWDIDLSDCVFGNPPVAFCREIEFYSDEDVQWVTPNAYDHEDGYIDMQWDISNEYSSDSIFDLSCGDDRCVYSITYTATDSSANTVTCDMTIQVIKRSCGDLYEDLGSSFDISCADTFEGTECLISCMHFLYQNEGSSTALCQAQDDGTVQWVYENNQTPYCSAIACNAQALQDPENGHFEVSPFFDGHRFVLECVDGFSKPMGVQSHYVCDSLVPFSQNYLEPVCLENQRPSSLSITTIGMYMITDDCTSYSADVLEANFQILFREWFLEHCYGDDDIELCSSVSYIDIDDYECRESNVAYAAITWGIWMTDPPLFDIGNIINDLEAAYLDGELILEDWDLSENLFAQPSITCSNFFYPDLTIYRCIPCSLGSIYDDVEEECTECEVGQYQEDFGQECLFCPDEYSTRSTGSIGVSSCLPKCSPGTYSTYGVEPCLPCPRGTYNFQSGQRECIECPNDDSTFVSWSTAISGCYTTGTCSTNSCNDNGNCISMGDSRIYCDCFDGFSGASCQDHAEPCDDNDCQNGATCEAVGTRYRCYCGTGFTGRLCENEIVNGEWGTWSEWSSCPLCSEDPTQNDQRTRSRVCDNPSPENGGIDCSGIDTDEEICSLFPCGECGDLPEIPHAEFTCVSIDETSSTYCYVQCDPGFESNQYDVLGFACGPEYNYRWYHGLHIVPEDDWSDYTSSFTCSGSQALVSIAESWGYEVYPTSREISQDDLELCGTASASNVAQLAEENSESVRKRRNVNEDDSIEIFIPDSHLTANININTVCSQDIGSRRKRSADSVTVAMTMEVQFENVDFFVDGEYDNATATAIQLLQYETIDMMNNVSASLTEGLINGTFTIPIGDEELTADPSTVTTQYSQGCPDGMIVSISSCVTCPAGTYQEEDECVSCPRGLYQESEGQVACEPCPADTTTHANGATSSSNCTALDPDNCAAGYYMENDSCLPCQQGYHQRLEGQTSCDPCPLGTYQDFIGQSGCYYCPDGLTTDSDGASSSDSCISSEDVCGQGTFENGGVCQECPLGYYQNRVGQTSCIPCPSVYMSTEETGSFYESDCYLAYESLTEVCLAGSYNSSSGCELCNEMEFQPYAGQQSCYSCPEGFETRIEGATDEAQCIENSGAVASQSKKKNSDDVPVLAIALPVGALVLIIIVGVVVFIKVKAPSASTGQASTPITHRAPITSAHEARSPRTSSASRTNTGSPAIDSTTNGDSSIQRQPSRLQSARSAGFIEVEFDHH